MNEVETLKEVEGRHIRAVLMKLSGHVVNTSKALGISRATLYRKMEDHGIEVGLYRAAFHPDEQRRRSGDSCQ